MTFEVDESALMPELVIVRVYVVTDEVDVLHQTYSIRHRFVRLLPRDAAFIHRLMLVVPRAIA